MTLMVLEHFIMDKEGLGIKSFSLGFYFWVMFILIIQPSCENCKKWGIIDLGSNYMLINADESDVFIIYCTTKKPCCNVGITLVPKLIDSIGYNSNYIIARSLGKDSTYYWIIKKSKFLEMEYDSGFSKKVKQDVFGPLNYYTFDSILKRYEIMIEFNKK